MNEEEIGIKICKMSKRLEWMGCVWHVDRKWIKCVTNKPNIKRPIERPHNHFG